MKKIIGYFLMFLMIFSLFSCTIQLTPPKKDDTQLPGEDEDEENKEKEDDADEDDPIEEESNVVDLQILTVNDTHGYIENSSTASMSKTAAFIKDEKQKTDKQTVVLSIGDMFQGTALSNITRGRVVVDSMNEIGFDSMVLGNHEFDWGIEEIAKFNDANIDNGEANFSFLACNIVYKGTDNLLEFTKPYEIIEQNGLKLGIVGAIGNVYNSISASKVKDYEFLNPLSSVKKYVYDLRTNQNCDIVVLAIHYGGGSDNSQFLSLTGDYKVDAIFNAHTHQKELVQTPIVQIQAQANGEYVGEVTFSYDITKRKIISSQGFLHQVSKMSKSDSFVTKIINDALTDIKEITNEELSYFSSAFNREQIAVYGSNVIANAFDVDFAMVNSGMYRTTFYYGQLITYGDMIKMVPFDNEIKMVTLTGAQIRRMYNLSYDLIEYPAKTSSYIYTSKGELLSDSKKYRVAAVDYVFDKGYYEFLYGSNIEFSSMFIRDILVMDLKLQYSWDIYDNAKIRMIEW